MSGPTPGASDSVCRSFSAIIMRARLRVLPPRVGRGLEGGAGETQRWTGAPGGPRGGLDMFFAFTATGSPRVGGLGVRAGGCLAAWGTHEGEERGTAVHVTGQALSFS